MVGKQEIQQIVDAVADRIWNGGSKLDTRLSVIETDMAVIKDRLGHLPCEDVRKLTDDVLTLKAKAGIWFPLMSAVIGGVTVGAIILFAKQFIR